MSFLIDTQKEIMHRIPVREDIPERGIGDIQNIEMEECIALTRLKVEAGQDTDLGPAPYTFNNPEWTLGSEAFIKLPGAHSQFVVKRLIPHPSVVHSNGWVIIIVYR